MLGTLNNPSLICDTKSATMERDATMFSGPFAFTVVEVLFTVTNVPHKISKVKLTKILTVIFTIEIIFTSLCYNYNSI